MWWAMPTLHGPARLAGPTLAPYHGGMNNRDIAAIFDEIADLLEFQNANPFRVRAYRNAARRITRSRRAADEDRRRSEARAHRSRRHRQGPGQKIGELLETGSLPMLEELRAAIPGGVLAMVRIPGLGPKKAAALYKELGITSLEHCGRPARPTRCRPSKASARKRRTRFWPALTSPPRPTSACTGPTPTRSCRSCSRTCASEGHPADRSGRQLPPRPRNDRRHRSAGRCR